MKSILDRTGFLTQLRCIVIFSILLTPIIFLIVYYNESETMSFQLLLFGTGWFSWTFVEYCLHRFWNHSKTVDINNHVVKMHLHHHTHPTEIKITARQRFIIIVIDFILISSSVLISKWLMLAAGAWTGISLFFFMHYLLHQKWTVRVFPGRVNCHMIHHCKEPETCYGVSTGWWDIVFNTLPKKNRQIAERIVEFYYRK